MDQINEIDASPIDKGAAYVAATMYKPDDFRPYLYKTTDYGKTWTKIVDGIPANDFTRVIRADPKRRGLLYAGTERGMYVSFDDGAHWQSLQLNLPIVPVTTCSCTTTPDRRHAGPRLLGARRPRAAAPAHARGRGKTVASLHAAADVAHGGRRTARRRRRRSTEGTNPPNGAIIDYCIHDQKPGTKVSLAFLGADGKVIREFKGEVQAEAAKPRECKAARRRPRRGRCTQEQREGSGQIRGRRGRRQNAEQAEARGRGRAADATTTSSPTSSMATIVSPGISALPTRRSSPA